MNIRMQNKALLVALLAFTAGLSVISAHAAQQSRALLFAANRGDVSEVRALLEADSGGDQLNPQLDATRGTTPLQLAAGAGHEPIVRLFLERGAVVDVANQAGYTPLFLAVRSNHGDVAQLLLCHGANPDVATQLGGTPLHSAALHGNVSITRLLLEAGASVHTVDQHGHTPLHAAVQLGHGPMARILVTYGADIDAPSRTGLTPMVSTGELENELKQLANNRLRAIRVWAGHLQDNCGLSKAVVEQVMLQMALTDKQRQRFAALGA